MRTQVGIIGAGPAGLLLSHLLSLRGIDSVVLEIKSLDHITSRVRAGVLEQTTVDLFRQVGLADRLDRQGLRHTGVELRFDRTPHRIDFAALTGGRGITVYAQHEVLKDLVARRRADGGELLFSVSEVSLHDIDTDKPQIQFTDPSGARRVLECDVIAGCDGFHGVSRPSIPGGVLRVLEREYPFAWLGILARTPPASEELIYTSHDRGFALHSMRTPEISRLYLQVDPWDDLSQWPDERIWAELQTRMSLSTGFTLRPGPILDRGITPMRSFVVEPMQHGRLFLAGDAAHIVPPTGAKGLNLAVADVTVLASALAAFFHSGDASRLSAYSTVCLRRVWRVQHFSWWMTSMLHRFPDQDEFQRRIQLSQLHYTVSSRAAATSLAENYVGLPL